MKERRSALVTGCCGFIGSNLVHRLVADGWIAEGVDDMSNGHQEFLDPLDVRSVPADLLHVYENQEHSQPEVLLMQGDFAHENVLSRIGRGMYDVIFHMAANPRVEYSVQCPVETTEINVLKTVALFYYAARHADRVIFSSSSSVYGNAESLPIREAAGGSPQSPYALQKKVAEEYASLFSKLYGLDVVCLRYFNVYGPRQRGDSPYSTAISAWCDKIKTSQPLRSDGDGSQTRDLVFVDDVVEANVLAAESSRIFSGESINIATGERHSNNKILERFQKKFGDLDVVNAPVRPGDVMHTEADITRAAELLEFVPRASLDEGLDRTWAWWNGLEE